jgi:hypothetical protein
MLLLLMERNDRSGGDKIINYHYDHKSKILAIEYENPEVVKSVIDFGVISFQNKKYKAKDPNESKIEGNSLKYVYSNYLN